jgi:hypothetical protein
MLEQKQKRLSGRAPPEKASEFVLRRRFAAGGRGNYEGYPGFHYCYLLRAER